MGNWGKQQGSLALTSSTARSNCAGALEGVLQVDTARLSGPDLERLRDNILKLRNLILECSPQAAVLFAEWAEANPGREPTEQQLREFLAPIGYGSVRIHFLAW